MKFEIIIGVAVSLFIVVFIETHGFIETPGNCDRDQSIQEQAAERGRKSLAYSQALARGKKHGCPSGQVVARPLTPVPFTRIMRPSNAFQLKTPV